MTDPRSVALAYIDACGRRDLDTVAKLLAPTLRFDGPGNALVGSEPYLAVLRRLGLVWVGSEVRKVFVDGDEVAVFYDFVTDTAAGRVPIVEWLRVENGRIVEVHLTFDRLTFGPASEEMTRRAATG
jgi:hypothetical protein